MLSTHGLRAAAKQYSPRSVTYVGTTIIEVDTTSAAYTFTGVNLGPTKSTRLIIVGVVGANSTTNRTISSVTVAGVAATLVVKRDNFTTNLGLYQIADTTNTSATVVVTFSGLENRGAIIIWSITDLVSNSVRVTGSNGSSLDNNLNITLNTTGISGGVGVCISSCNNSTRTVTFTGLTENVEQAVDAAIVVAGASRDNLPASLTVSTAWSGGLIANNLVGAKYF